MKELRKNSSAMRRNTPRGVAAALTLTPFAVERIGAFIDFLVIDRDGREIGMSDLSQTIARLPQSTAASTVRCVFDLLNELVEGALQIPVRLLSNFRRPCCSVSEQYAREPFAGASFLLVPDSSCSESEWERERERTEVLVSVIRSHSNSHSPTSKPPRSTKRKEHREQLSPPVLWDL